MRGHSEWHRVGSVGWLRAGVLGANDGLISTASLIMGVAAAQLPTPTVLITGLAGLVGGALSMAAGEYVSVSSQADTEKADLARERRELAETPRAEHRELTDIYVGRGLTRDLAEQVATQLTAHDALAAHARDELGITAETRARPLQAAVASALAFATGALLPLLVVIFVPRQHLSEVTFAAMLLLLACLGAVGARLGSAPMLRAALRVAFWGAVAMGATALIGRLFHVAPGAG